MTARQREIRQRIQDVRYRIRRLQALLNFLAGRRLKGYLDWAD